jgi:KaiC/GvpD/RAD55 family RecA-like ATPase
MLDDAYGGVFSKRSFLISGKRGSGKTIMGIQFLRQGLLQNERCLYLSTIGANDLGILAESMGFPFSLHIDDGNLTLLEYESFISHGGLPGQDMLPPEGFDQLRTILDANSIKRVVLDTVLPWVSVPTTERLAEQVFSFVRSFDRLGVTTLMTLPKPVSSMAFRLRKCLEDVVPISVLLTPESGEEPATLQVLKYLGEKRLVGAVPYEIQPESGVVALETDAGGTPSPAPAIEAPPAPLQEPVPVRFSAIPMVRTGNAPPGPPPRSPTAPPPPQEAPARLSSVWKPNLKEGS